MNRTDLDSNCEATDVLVVGLEAAFCVRREMAKVDDWKS